MSLSGRHALISLILLAVCLAAAPAMAGPKEDIKAGNAAAQAQNLDQAIKLFSKAIKSGQLSPENLAVAYNNRGSAYDDKGMGEKAIADFNQAIKIKPKYAEAYYNRSFTYEKKGMLASAMKDIEQAVRLQPRDDYYTNRMEYLNHRLSKQN